MDLPTSWHSIDDKAKASKFQSRLLLEIGNGHTLFNVPFQVIATNEGSDDVLLQLLDETCRFAEVHLTWTWNPPDKPPWPLTKLYQSFTEWTEHAARNEVD